MRRKQGPPWGAILALPTGPRSYELIRGVALQIIRGALDGSKTLREASRKLGIGYRALYRLAEENQQDLCQQYEQCAERTEMARLKKRWPPGRELAQTPKAIYQRKKRAELLGTQVG